MAGILNIGTSGLHAAKQSLETTGHNIANVNTDGFSRQRVVQQTAPTVERQGLVKGTGTRIRNIERSHDPFVEKRLRNNTSEHSYFNTRADELGNIENIFNEIDHEGLNHILNDFYNAFRDLAIKPEDATVRSIVRDKADLVAKDFKRIKTTLSSAAAASGERLNKEVGDINGLTKEITDLNKKIMSFEISGQQAPDLRDQRDLAVTELSKSFKVHTYVDKNDNYTVHAVGVGTLVTGGFAQKLATRMVSKNDSSSDTDGSVEVFFKDRPSATISSKFKMGKLSSLIDARNGDLKKLENNVDEIAFNLANAVNSIHNRGFLYNPQNPQEAVSAGNFFKTPISKEGAAEFLSLDESIQKDVNKIATALSPGSPGDNRIALAISKLQDEKFMDNGHATMSEFYLQTIGDVATSVGKANFDSEQMEGILAQTIAMKERISGVSLDEEAANMVRFQHAYQASAKVMQTAHEMFDTVLGIKR